MKITWDSKAKAVYVCVVDENVRNVVDLSKKVTEDVYLDYSAERVLLGIEILNTDQPVVEDITGRAGK